jgi:hypothetical protein
MCKRRIEGDPQLGGYRRGDGAVDEGKAEAFREHRPNDASLGPEGCRDCDHERARCFDRSLAPVRKVCGKLPGLGRWPLSSRSPIRGGRVAAHPARGINRRGSKGRRDGFAGRRCGVVVLRSPQPGGHRRDETDPEREDERRVQAVGEGLRDQVGKEAVPEQGSTVCAREPAKYPARAEERGERVEAE